MAVNKLDAVLLRKAFLAGAARLESQKDRINELNVFPVPDGDTGTNMTLTIMSAVRAVNEVEEPTVDAICKAMSSGSLRGARGNSGVILSQLLRGLSREMKSNPDNITVETMAAAFTRATDTAYKAVMKPKEGTILTVARGGSDKAKELVGTTEDLVEFLEQVVAYMEEVLDRTPDLLPVLKEAGVVDSGGTGLLECMKGALDAIAGKDVPLATGIEKAEAEEKEEEKYGFKAKLTLKADKPFTSADQIAIEKAVSDIASFKTEGSGSEVKMSFATDKPGQVLEEVLSYGSVSEMNVENLHTVIKETKPAPEKEERETAELSEEHKDIAFIAVSAGSGLSEVFRQLGADLVIEGGQTMNPSTEDVLNAITKINADNVFIFPNNKNIILAANQARDLTEDKKVYVIPTKTIPQGITALIAYEYGSAADDVEAAMLDAIKEVKSGEVTYAVRDTSVDGRPIKQGDIMGIGDDGIISVTRSVEDTVSEMADTLIDESSSLVTLYYGADIKAEDAESLKEKITAEHSGVDVELQEGGQPVYYYIISVE